MKKCRHEGFRVIRDVLHIPMHVLYYLLFSMCSFNFAALVFRLSSLSASPRSWACCRPCLRVSNAIGVTTGATDRVARCCLLELIGSGQLLVAVGGFVS